MNSYTQKVQVVYDLLNQEPPDSTYPSRILENEARYFDEIQSSWNPWIHEFSLECHTWYYHESYVSGDYGPYNNGACDDGGGVLSNESIGDSVGNGTGHMVKFHFMEGVGIVGIDLGYRDSHRGLREIAEDP
jgi:hypothetical protein